MSNTFIKAVTLTSLLLGGVCIASAQSTSFPIMAGSTAIGQVSTSNSTSSGTCGRDNLAYTMTIYNPVSWQLNSSAKASGGGTLYNNAQFVFVSGGGESGCPMQGWQGSPSGTVISFSNGYLACPLEPQSSWNSDWSGGSVTAVLNGSPSSAYFTVTYPTGCAQ